jgi:hypothetical protein
MVRKKRSRSRLILGLAVLTAVIIVLAFITYTYLNAQSAHAAVPGVKAGDVFTYTIRGFYSSNDPNATMPENFLELNTTDWYRITVTNVSDAQVSIDTAWHFSNGTELDGSGYVNVETGINYPTQGFWAIYAANLKAGDNVRPNGPDRSTINETITKDYGATTRKTNHLSLVMQYYDANDPTYTKTWTEYMQTYFDQQTGILVQFSDISMYTNPTMTLTTTWTLKDTNVWTIS